MTPASQLEYIQCTPGIVKSLWRRSTTSDTKNDKKSLSNGLFCQPFPIILSIRSGGAVPLYPLGRPIGNMRSLRGPALQPEKRHGNCKQHATALRDDRSFINLGGSRDGLQEPILTQSRLPTMRRLSLELLSYQAEHAHECLLQDVRRTRVNGVGPKCASHERAWSKGARAYGVTGHRKRSRSGNY